MSEINICLICGQKADTSRASDKDKYYDALNVDCDVCGLLRLSGKFIHLNKFDDSWTQQLRSVLSERTDAEKNRRVWVTTNKVLPINTDDESDDGIIQAMRELASPSGWGGSYSGTDKLIVDLNKAILTEIRILHDRIRVSVENERIFSKTVRIDDPDALTKVGEILSEAEGQIIRQVINQHLKKLQDGIK